MLEKGCVYVVPLVEGLALPERISAVANAKSSTGRLDLFTRLITDRGTEFDRIERRLRRPALRRDLAALVLGAGPPRHAAEPDPLPPRLGRARRRRAAPRSTPPSGWWTAQAHIAGGLAFSVDLEPRDGGLVGYRAKPHTGLIDLDRIGHYDPADFWEPVTARDRRIILDPGAFYILVSREAVHVPPDYAAEMAPYLAMVGEFRVHYAGFFDPGFGHAGAGGTGSRGVLEVRCHEAPFALDHGQVVGRLVYERMAERPEILYGRDTGSNYQGQGLKLSKHFRAA